MSEMDTLLLSPFTHDELEHAISHLSTSWQCTASMYLVYNFTIISNNSNNK